MEIGLHLGFAGECGLHHRVLFVNEIFIKCRELIG